MYRAIIHTSNINTKEIFDVPFICHLKACFLDVSDDANNQFSEVDNISAVIAFRMR